MKLLLESYESIIRNNFDNKGSNIDLASDMNKFNMNFTAKAKLEHFESGSMRKHCNSCTQNSITFKSSGAFCPVCGFIFPF